MGWPRDLKQGSLQVLDERKPFGINEQGTVLGTSLLEHANTLLVLTYWVTA